jgi:hypothetical protein
MHDLCTGLQSGLVGYIVHVQAEAYLARTGGQCRGSEVYPGKFRPPVRKIVYVYYVYCT